MALHVRGFTLAELLVSLAVVGLVMAGSLGLLIQGQQSYLAGAGRIEAQQNARVALERMASEIRAAGFNPRGAGFSAIVNQTEQSLTLQNDWSGDGIISGRGEVVVYLLRGSTLRRNAGGGAQPVVEGVERLRFVYLDSAGRPTAEPAAIRSVEVSITTRSRGAAAGGGASLTTAVRLRNR
ncbi:MAG: prepilin-type N-terminal cleavage/methylation domain-containing protein [Candidatus Rokubacteria bacterium]|nr:prepilin-type N-terminal cleavage/methylation domain-containing protein [Candidatus Rokubacteria bacterium]